MSVPVRSLCLVLLSLLALHVPATRATCPYPYYAGAGLSVDLHSQVNGHAMVAGTGNAIDPATGRLIHAGQTLGSLDPATFPSFSGSTDYRGSASGLLPGATYRHVTLVSGSAPPGTFRMESLTLNGTVTLSGGTYYVRSLQVGRSAVIHFAAGTDIRVARQVDIDRNARLVASGAAAGRAPARFYLYGPVDFRADREVSFAGIVVGTDSGAYIEFERYANITGALVTAGRVKFYRYVSLTFDPAVASALAETEVCGGSRSARAPAALNAVDPGTDAVAGQISTKTAGAGFSLDIHALNASRTSRDDSFSGDVQVELVANKTSGVTLDANNCPTSGTVLTVATVTLSAGRATLAVPAVADVWREVRVRLRYPAAGPYRVIACSTDNFAIKPARLVAVASHADWQHPGTTAILGNTSARGGVIHKAGRPFTLRLTAHNATGALASQYDGNPTPSVGCVLPGSGCVTGSLSTGAFTASGGTVTSSSASYSEVGAISARFVDIGFAAVDADDTAASCTGYHVCADAIAIGRFVPDHFDVAVNTPRLRAACGRFTYLGQPFDYAQVPVLTITAKNTAGATTVNYTGALFKLSAAGITGQTHSAASGVVAAVAGSLPAPVVTDLGGGVGQVSFSVGDAAAGGGLRFLRGNAPTAPFDAELALSFSLADSEGVTPLSNPLSFGTATPGGGIAFAGGKTVRFGRLRLANATGTELRALPVPLTAQYWNGRGFVTNGDDDCTVLPVPVAVALTVPRSPGLTFYPQTADNQLAAGETMASLRTPLASGHAGLVLSAPGAGNHGYLDVVADAPVWLEYDWDGADQGGDGRLLDDNPRARVAFGKRRGVERLILRREMY